MSCVWEEKCIVVPVYLVVCVYLLCSIQFIVLRYQLVASNTIGILLQCLFTPSVSINAAKTLGDASSTVLIENNGVARNALQLLCRTTQLFSMRTVLLPSL